MAEEISTVNGEGNWKIRYKVDRDHLVPLVGPIAEILKRRCQEVGGKGALFWPDVDRTQEYPQELRKATAELKKLTGLQDFRPNDCRRTMRRHIESLGVRREVGEALLNHAKGKSGAPMLSMTTGRPAAPRCLSDVLPSAVSAAALNSSSNY